MNFRRVLLTLSLPALWLTGLTPGEIPVPQLANPADAIIGMPLSPLSVAGVARRTTRRAVVYDTAAVSAAAVTTAAVATPAPPPAPVYAPAPAVSGPPSGTIVSTLPSGCISTVQNNVSYFNCAGVLYRVAFQSNNVVYVVQ